MKIQAKHKYSTIVCATMLVLSTHGLGFEESGEVPVAAATASGNMHAESGMQALDLDNLTLERAKTLALAASSSVRSGMMRARAGQLALRSAYGEYLPTLGLSGLFQDHQKISHTGIFFEPQPFEVYNWRLRLEALIFDGFARQRSIEFSRQQSEKSRFDVGERRRSVLWTVVSFYHEGVLLLKRQAQAELNLEFEKGNLDVSLKKFEAGTVSETDVLHFRQRLIEVKNQQIELESQWRTLMHKLAALFDLDNRQLASLRSLHFEPYPEPSSDSLDSYQRAGSQQRGDLRMAMAELEMQQIQKKLSRSTFYPRVSLFADYANNDRSGFSVDEAGRASSAGVQVEWNLFRGFSDHYNVLKNEWLEEATVADVSSKERTIRAEIAEQYEQMLKFNRLRASMKELVEIALKSREHVRQQFEAGRVDLLRINDAQNRYDRARSEYDLAEVSYALAREGLELLSGND